MWMAVDRIIKTAQVLNFDKARLHARVKENWRPKQADLREKNKNFGTPLALDHTRLTRPISQSGACLQAKLQLDLRLYPFLRSFFMMIIS